MGAGAGLAYRSFRWLLLVTILIAAAHIFSPQLYALKEAFGTVLQTFTALPRLNNARDEINNIIAARTQELRDDVSTLNRKSEVALKNRLRAIAKRKGEIEDRTSNTTLVIALLTGDGVVEAMAGPIELIFLQHEGALIAALLERQSLDALWKEQVDSRNLCEAARQTRNVYLRNASVLIRISFSPEGRHFKSLDADWQTLCAAYATKRAAFVARRHLPSPEVVSSLLNSQLAAVAEPLTDKIKKLEGHWLTKIRDALVWALPKALAALLLLPVGAFVIRGTLYWLARFASRGSAITLLPKCNGSIEVAMSKSEPAADSLTISAVSQPIAVNQEHELLVRPEFVQSASLQGTRDTKWLLDWSMPIRSLASGMVALTRIRATAAESFVISDKTDPFNEIGVITLRGGSAFALQPHHLVGVIQPKNRSIKITRHYRIGTLAAWLTLQFRYLVFHGPATLIVRGCRGIRVAQAGRGRSIDQAATIGFSANLHYSTKRCEPFGAYLTGKHGLFNDQFSGGHGFYVYEEMPNSGKTGGVTRRGPGGILEAIWNVLGNR